MVKQIILPNEERIIAEILFFIFLILIPKTSFSQHEHHTMNDSVKTDNHNMQMNSAFSPNLPMSRDGSGTSWQPDASPVFMYMKMFGDGEHGTTSLMVHGNIFLRYTSQDISKAGERGGQTFDAPNWFMAILKHTHENDVFSLLTMFSLDPVTEGGNGYPLLFQSGETYNGKPLVDRQHPHDLIAEIAVNYTHSFSKAVDANIYFGYPGEPALGPNVFMHRVSAINNPDAVLGHHWQDATHITFGVATVGIRYDIFKIEGSIFTGREPDEERYGFDKPTFDSYSYRINANPNDNFALQFSQGFIKSPEAIEPEIDITRTTASVIHTKILNQESFIASSFIWGLNHSSEDESLHSVLIESNYRFSENSIYARAEFIQKDAHELQLLQFDKHAQFNIGAFTIGFNRILHSHFQTDLSIGLQGTINFPDENLKTIYGDLPLSAQIYLKIFPSMMLNHNNH